MEGLDPGRVVLETATVAAEVASFESGVGPFVDAANASASSPKPAPNRAAGPAAEAEPGERSVSGVFGVFGGRPPRVTELGSAAAPRLFFGRRLFFPAEAPPPGARERGEGSGGGGVSGDRGG